MMVKSEISVKSRSTSANVNPLRVWPRVRRRLVVGMVRRPRPAGSGLQRFNVQVQRPKPLEQRGPAVALDREEPVWLAKAESVENHDAIRRDLLLALTNAVEAFESRVPRISIIMDIVARRYRRIRRVIEISMRIAERG